MPHRAFEGEFQTMFLVCGEALWDLFARESDTGLTFDARIGGSPFNVAVGMARLGHSAALFTGISTDRLGQRLLHTLEKEGVQTNYLRRSDRPTTISLVDLAEDGSPAYVFHGFKAADRTIKTEDLPILAEDVWGVHAGSFSLVAEPVGASLLALFRREAGRRFMSLDPNVRLNVEPDLGVWRSRIDSYLPLCDLVKVSSEDLALLYPGCDIVEIVHSWRNAGAGLVVVTLGASGAMAFGERGSAEIAGVGVNVVDTVGAGDSFQAALVAGLDARGVHTRATLDALDEQDLQELMKFACHAAALTCQRRGADLPRQADMAAAAEE